MRFEGTAVIVVVAIVLVVFVFVAVVYFHLEYEQIRRSWTREQHVNPLDCH